MNDLVKIWHNPRCSKSRKALQLLQERGFHPEVYEYLKTPPSREDVRGVLSLLNMGPGDLLRRKEQAYKDLGLATANADAILDAMESHPVLIERPIIIRGERAVIARPTERIEDIL